MNIFTTYHFLSLVKLEILENVLEFIDILSDQKGVLYIDVGHDGICNTLSDWLILLVSFTHVLL